ncbi:uncharacterized protein [Lepeophtheirus salmonis]|uniref:uncharacterized protein n=1 Tax=Lepeophtheirus salmonis TaxID=72036 RepID=UPI001AE60B8E|nr:uncharacterized protein LOC121123728 [Lepeophtheirus salmonis]XP_040574798.1 uncharacterized protein LOC121123728 [Lepeophtheirus salmonis]
MNKVCPWSTSIHAAKQLFKSGRQSTKSASLVRPHFQLDKSDQEILHNLTSRGWPEFPIPLPTLREKFHEWQNLKNSSSRLDNKSKNQMWDIEEEFLPFVLAIPNDLCEFTLSHDSLSFSHDSTCKTTPFQGIEPLEYEDYLAKLEIRIYNELQERFVVQEGYFSILGPDFIKKTVDIGFQSNVPFQLDHLNDLLIAGGASIHSLVGFLIKNELYSEFPPKLFAFGRIYDAGHPFPQRSIASTLCLSYSQKESLHDREEIVESLKEYFNVNHNISFDIFFKGAPDLTGCESHSLVFKTKDGTIISEISTFNDYLSKRFSIMNQNGTFCHLVGGTLCDVTSLLHSCY